jgi:hypothetical protein
MATSNWCVGVFLRAAGQEKLYACYEEHLGIERTEDADGPWEVLFSLSYGKRTTSAPAGSKPC